MTAPLRFHPPCLATSTKAHPSGSQWVHQPKLDGYRLQVVKEGGTVRLYTKGDIDWANKLTALADALAGLSARSAVLDCEMVMADASGLPDFTLLHRTKGRHRGAGLHLYAFDLLHLNGKDLRDLPLIERARRLAGLLERSRVPVLHLVPSFPGRRRAAALLRGTEAGRQCDLLLCVCSEWGEAMEALGVFKRAIVPETTFDGEQMKVVGEAFERAWMLLEPGLTDRGGDITNNRTKLAKAVLSAARLGVEPSEALAKKALRVMFADSV